MYIYFVECLGTKLIYFHMSRARGRGQGAGPGPDGRGRKVRGRPGAKRAGCNEHLHNAQEWFSVSFGCNRVCCLLLISMWACALVCMSVWHIACPMPYCGIYQDQCVWASAGVCVCSLTCLNGHVKQMFIRPCSCCCCCFSCCCCYCCSYHRHFHFNSSSCHAPTS